MQAINNSSFLEKLLSKEHASMAFLFIQSPFCGTCHLAKQMIKPLEVTWVNAHVDFYELNASLFPDFMREQEIKSVPCLIILHKGKRKDTVYAFHSVSNMYQRLLPFISEV